MAERRMFSKSVVCSSRLALKSPSVRALYYELGMAADDDGCVDAIMVMRTYRSTRRELNELVRENLVQILDGRLLICHIVDWEQNNKIRKDRYHRGPYYDLLKSLRPGAAKSPPPDNPSAPEARQGKDRIDEDRQGQTEPDAPCVPPAMEEVTAYCRQRRSPVDPQRFYDYYQSRGWCMGKDTVRDWKALLRNWEKQERRQSPAREEEDYSWQGVFEETEEGIS